MNRGIEGMQQYTLSLFGSSMNPAENKTVVETVAVDWEDLPELFTTRNWSPAVYENGARNLSNYRGTPSLFAFDIDEGMTLEEAKREFQSFQCIIYTSRNHQKIKRPGTPAEKPACDRFRVIFPLEEPITSDSDFKATWDAYADKYPIDPQTRSSSMFFFKGLEVVHVSHHGMPLPVITAEKWNEVTKTHYEFVKDESNPNRGRISSLSQDFLTHGAKPGLFNARLFKCAVDHLEQRFTKEEFLEICAKAAARTPAPFHPLDEVDLATVNSAFNREPKYGARVHSGSAVEAQKEEIAARIMEGKFLQCVQGDATLWYEIKDYELKEVTRFSNEQILERHIASEIKKPENHYNTVKKVSEDGDKPTFQPITKAMTVREVMELWKLHGETLEKIPEPILWQGVDGWCHKRFNFELRPNQPHPAWDEFLGRLSNPEVFLAWVFSCFVAEHRSRQSLWLLGKHGQDGKSQVLGLLGELFGDALATLTASQIKADSRFLMSQFVGKRLVTYSDCMHRNFPQTELFRNLTGGDSVSVEFKGAGTIHMRLQLKVAIASNFEPIMSAANYDKSRVIIIEVSESRTKDDPTWAEKLRAELPALLGDAAEAYRRLCPHHGNIRLPEEISQRLDDFAADEALPHDALMDELFEVDYDADRSRFVKGIELSRVMEHRYRHNAKKQREEFTIFLETRHKIFKMRGNQCFFFRGLVFKTTAITDLYRIHHGGPPSQNARAVQLPLPRPGGPAPRSD